MDRSELEVSLDIGDPVSIGGKKGGGREGKGNERERKGMERKEKTENKSVSPFWMPFMYLSWSS